MDKIKFKSITKVAMVYKFADDHIMCLPTAFYQDARLIEQAKAFRRLYEDWQFYLACYRYGGSGLRRYADREMQKAVQRIAHIRFHLAFVNGYPRLFELVTRIRMNLYGKEKNTGDE